jgi:hypothetical protein
MSNLLTNSRLRTWRECRRLHRLKYVDGWRTVTQADVLRFGSLIHSGLEAWWKDDGSGRLAAALDAMRGKGGDPFEQVAAEELLAGYDARWSGDEARYEVLAVEETFTAPLLNPDTGAASRTWILAGKLDGFVLDRHTGAKLLLEHKTTGENIADPADPYWAKLGMDSQVSHYYLGAEGLGHTAEGCLYDVLLRPRMKPLRATPEAARKYTKAGDLYANQRAEDEAPEDFRARVRADIEATPEKYFQRREIARTDNDIVEYLADVWAEGRMMREAEIAKRAPRNPEACHRFGTCSFWDVCAYGLDPASHPEMFEQVANVHPELHLQEA